MEIFLYEHLSPGNWDEKFFDKIALLLQQWPKWHNFCLVCIYYKSRNYQRGYDATLCSKILVLFLNFIPVDQASLTSLYVWTVWSVVGGKVVQIP